MQFEDALKLIKEGKRVTNSKWNGKGQYAFMMKGYTSIPANLALSNGAGIPVGENVEIAPYLLLKNAQGAFVNWVPSIGDIFSDGWRVVNEGYSCSNIILTNTSNSATITHKDFGAFLNKATYLGCETLEFRKQIKLVE